MTKFFSVTSPFVAHCSLEEVGRTAEAVRSRVVLRPELTNSWGGAHGGLIVTLLDATMTIAGRYAVDPEGQKGVATIDLTTSFIGQAKKTLECTAKVVVVRGAAIFAEARVVNEDNELVARGTATLRAMKS